MKKLLISGLAGSIVLFIWQFLSWAALGIHADQMAYTPKQDQLLEAIASVDIEEGDYFVPQAKPGSSAEEMQAMQDKYIGTPWAKVTYRKNLQNKMAINMVRGWAISFVAAILFCWLLMNFKEINMTTSVLAAISVGVIGYLVNPYLNSVWFEGNSLPDLIDAIVPWAIIGAFNAWFLNK
jgi:hypothetical protein